MEGGCLGRNKGEGSARKGEEQEGKGWERMLERREGLGTDAGKKGGVGDGCGKQ